MRNWEIEKSSLWITSKIYSWLFYFRLTPKIRNEMAIQILISISQTIGIAKLIEAKLKNVKPKFQKPFSNSFNHTNPTSRKSSFTNLKAQISSVSFLPLSPHPHPYHLNYSHNASYKLTYKIGGPKVFVIIMMQVYPWTQVYF